MDLIITPILTIGVGLAQIAVDFMRMRQDNRLANQNSMSQTQLAQMEHEFQLQLQEARHQHEILLENIRSHNSIPPITVVLDAGKHIPMPPVYIEAATNIPDYLNLEAALLCNNKFNVVVDPINEGYAVAVCVRDDYTIAFWLPPAYPNKPPTVFAITSLILEQIQFEDYAWEPTRKLIEVVDALAYCY